MKVYITQGASETAVEIHCTEAYDRIGKLKKYIGHDLRDSIRGASAPVRVDVPVKSIQRYVRCRNRGGTLFGDIRRCSRYSVYNDYL